MAKHEEQFIDEGTEIASYIGDPNLAEVAAQVIAAFHERGIIAHGIKRAASVGTVAVHGVLNNCPDGGKMQSYWTSGRRVFLSEGTPYTPMRTFDTTFFHYAVGGIALTSIDELRNIGIAPSGPTDHATITIDHPVPVSAIDLILVPSIALAENMSDASARAHRQQLERSLILELAQIARHGIRPGTVHEVDG